MKGNIGTTNTAGSLIEDLKGIIIEAGSEDVEVVVRHCCEHEFASEDNLRNFSLFYDKKENKAVVYVKN